MQQMRIRSIKEGIGNLENEVKELKAKLYDKGQTNLSTEIDSQEEESVNSEEEDPEEG